VYKGGSVFFCVVQLSDQALFNGRFRTDMEERIFISDEMRKDDVQTLHDCIRYWQVERCRLLEGVLGTLASAGIQLSPGTSGNASTD
jgi:hypothetical protein